MKLFKKRNRLFWSLLLSAFVMVCLNVRAADDDEDEEDHYSKVKLFHPRYQETMLWAGSSEAP